MLKKMSEAAALIMYLAIPRSNEHSRIHQTIELVILMLVLVGSTKEDARDVE